MSVYVRLRGGRGLGDALYVRPVADELVRRRPKNGRVVVLTDYPDVFIGCSATVVPFQRVKTDVVAHYVGGKRNKLTTQWQDVCESAKMDIPLRFSWPVRNVKLIAALRERARGKSLVLVHGGRIPMGRVDGFGMELMPSQASFEAALAVLRDRGCYLVQIGKAKQLYPLKCDEDLNNRTSVSDILDLGVSCDAVLAQCSFAVPLAEAFSKPLLVLWGDVSRSVEAFVRCTTPQKVLSSPMDRYALDIWARDEIAAAAMEFASLMTSTVEAA